MAKIRVIPFKPDNPNLNYDPEQPDCIKIKLSEGRIELESVSYPLGSPQKPMTSEEILTKFTQNVSKQITDETVISITEWLHCDNIIDHLNTWR